MQAWDRNFGQWYAQYFSGSRWLRQNALRWLYFGPTGVVEHLYVIPGVYNDWKQNDQIPVFKYVDIGIRANIGRSIFTQ